MATSTGVIKEVISGDTVRIVGKPVEDGPPPEITITLSNCLAPRLMKAGSGPDEPFAWESREFLRELCIGKRVNFRIVQVVAAINRTFGEVFLIADGSELVNLQLVLIEAGWATAKSGGGSAALTESDPNYFLFEAEQRARAAKCGMHAGTPPSRPPMNASPTTAEIDSIAARYKGKPTHAIIEYVRDGSSLRVLILDCWTYVSLSITGVYCPRINASSGSGSAAPAGPEPFAEQARLFTQMRLLNRKLLIDIESVESNGGGVNASILHPKGNIAVDLIRSGLGKVLDRTLGLLPKETVALMRAAESEAKEQRRCIWQDFTPTTPSIARRSYLATCIEVISGDTIAVVEGTDLNVGEERRLTIAGIRVPRMGSMAAGVKSASEPWAVECRDALISLILGKTILVNEEYARANRIFVSIEVSMPQGRGKLVAVNVAEHLLSNGLCNCVRYKIGSEDERVTHYVRINSNYCF